MELRLLEAILEKYSREISNAFSEEETDESRTYVLRNFVGRATEILSECKNWTGRSITLSVFGLPRLRLHVSGSWRVQQRACMYTVTKAFQSNEGQSVTTRCITMFTERVSATESLLYKRDEHYRSTSSQWEIIHSLEKRRCISIQKKIRASWE